jgi:membrane protein required for colicin V production
MNPLDWLLVVLLLYSTVRAAMRGFVREAFALAGLILGFLFACWYYGPVALFLRGLINSQPLAQFCAFLLIVAAVMIVATLLGAIIRRTASAIGLSALDRLGGALFGFARGLVLGAAILLAITAFLPTAPWVANSRLAPYLLQGSHAVSFVMPRQLRQQLLEGLSRLKHTNAVWINRGPASHTGTYVTP